MRYPIKIFSIIFLLSFSLSAKDVNFDMCNKWLEKQRVSYAFDTKGFIKENFKAVRSQYGRTTFKLLGKNSNTIKYEVISYENDNIKHSENDNIKHSENDNIKHSTLDITHDGKPLTLESREKKVSTTSSHGFNHSGYFSIPIDTCVVKKLERVVNNKKVIIFNTQACRDIAQFFKDNKYLDKSSKKAVNFLKSLNDKYHLSPSQGIFAGYLGHGNTTEILKRQQEALGHGEILKRQQEALGHGEILKRQQEALGGVGVFSAQGGDALRRHLQNCQANGIGLDMMADSVWKVAPNSRSTDKKTVQ